MSANIEGMNTLSPFYHADGSSCYDENCELGNITAADKELFEKQREFASREGENFIHADVIAPIEEFYTAVKRGDIYRQKHPKYPYHVFKYLPKTQYSRNWTPVTLSARGLVLNYETGEVVARPFGKFFNYSEHLTDPEKMVGKIEVMEKLDGSLGVSLPTPDGLQISTSGGFGAFQSVEAIRIYREKYEGKWEPNPELTYTWEIIYPENRIVVDYGSERDLFLLGAVNKRTGRSVPLSELNEWGWKKPEIFTNFTSLSEIVESPSRKNKEGFIVHFTETDTRLKIKHEEYLKIHRVATNLTRRSIWDVLRSGQDFETFKQNIPEEFLEYVETEEKSIRSEFEAVVAEHYRIFNESLKVLSDDAERKQKALWVKEHVPAFYQSGVMGLLFTGELNSKAVKKIWESIKPAYERGFWLAGDGKTSSEE